MTQHPSGFIRLPNFERYPETEMIRRATKYHHDMKRRRSIREFSDRSFPREIVDQCLLAAGSAPNGANLQPWHFVVVSDPNTKKEIRIAAEQEEKAFYEARAPQPWLDALAPLGTDANKPFLETAPYLIVVFSKAYELRADGTKVKNYYAVESVGIATGMLITGLHLAGVATLTHTPSPMNFLNPILGRPPNERPFLLLVTGYPIDDCHVPNISKKPLNEIATYF
jgi:nitroreductase